MIQVESSGERRRGAFDCERALSDFDMRSMSIWIRQMDQRLREGEWIYGEIRRIMRADF